MSYIITVFLALCYFFACHLLGMTNMYSVGAGIGLFLITILYLLFWTTFLEPRAKRTEQFLLKKKHNPRMYLIYAIANQVDRDVQPTIEKLLDKKQTRSHHAFYRVVEAIYFNNVTEARNYVEKIKTEQYRLYYRASILLQEGNIDAANEMIDQLKKRWMKNALLAERERRLGHFSNAERYAQAALKKSKGLNRYLLHQRYQREFGIHTDINEDNNDQVQPTESVALVTEKRSSSVH